MSRQNKARKADQLLRAATPVLLLDVRLPLLRLPELLSGVLFSLQTIELNSKWRQVLISGACEGAGSKSSHVKMSLLARLLMAVKSHMVTKCTSSELWSCLLTFSVCPWRTFIFFVHISRTFVSFSFSSGSNFLPSYSIVKPKWLKCWCCRYPFQKTSKPASSSGLLQWSLHLVFCCCFLFSIVFFFNRTWQKACLSHLWMMHLLFTKHFTLHIWILKTILLGF